MEKTKKEIKEKAPKPKKEVVMVSYSIKMVIPTGQYANIQPEIIVKAGSMEEAHAFIAPHINKLWKEYYMVSERRPAEKVDTSVPGTQTPVVEATPASPVSSVALVKAMQAVNSCLSLDALKMISNQIQASVKLTPDDKASLLPFVIEKENELNGKTNPTQEVS